MSGRGQIGLYEELAEIERARRTLLEQPYGGVDAWVEQVVRSSELLDQSTPTPEPAAYARQVLQQAQPTVHVDAESQTPGARPRSLGLESIGAEALAEPSGGLDVAVELRMERIPTAHVHALDPADSPLVTFSIASPSGKSALLRVQSHIEGYSARAVETICIEEGDTKTHVVPQLPTIFPERLEAVREATRATLHVHVEDMHGDDAPRVLSHRTLRIWLLPRTTAVLSQRDPATGRHQNTSRYLVSWVTPNAPEVMECLREAADRTDRDTMAGYQEDETGVERQVLAVFKAIKARKLTYVNSVIAVGKSDSFVQRVRLPRESLAHRSANCIDGAVLYASILEAGSLRPGLAVIPGHAFLAWRTTREGDWDYLETTMTGSHPFAEALEAGRKTAERMKAIHRLTVLDVALLRTEGVYPFE